MTWAPKVSLRRQWGALSPGKLAAPMAFAMALLFGAAAQAQQFDYSAVLASQGRINGPVNAGGIVWQCNAKYCTTRGPWPVPGVKSCNALAMIVGPLASYGYKGRMLSPGDMASCNGKQTMAAQQQAPANASQPNGQQPQSNNQSMAAINPLGALFQNLASGNNSNNNGSSGSSGSSTPAPPSSAPESLSIRSTGLTVTGTGALAAMSSAAITVHTTSLRVTGTGALAASSTSTPVRIRTTTLTVRGTGSL